MPLVQELSAVEDEIRFHEMEDGCLQKTEGCFERMQILRADIIAELNKKAPYRG